MNQVNLIKGSDLKLKLKKKGVLSVDICRAFGYNKTTVSRYDLGVINEKIRDLKILLLPTST